ncbi:MAG: PqqD family protein [Fimbriimonadales bacterium]
MPLKTLFRKRQPPQIDRKQVLRMYPFRNPAVRYEDREDDTCLLIVSVKPRGIFRWLSRIFKLPNEHRIELDELGSTVWRLCDGEHTVEAIVRQLVQTYRLERREAEYSLFAFLNTLSQRGFIAYLKTRR